MLLLISEKDSFFNIRNKFSELKLFNITVCLSRQGFIETTIKKLTGVINTCTCMCDTLYVKRLKSENYQLS